MLATGFSDNYAGQIAGQKRLADMLVRLSSQVMVGSGARANIASRALRYEPSHAASPACQTSPLAFERAVCTIPVDLCPRCGVVLIHVASGSLNVVVRWNVEVERATRRAMLERRGAGHPVPPLALAPGPDQGP